MCAAFSLINYECSVKIALINTVFRDEHKEDHLANIPIKLAAYHAFN